MEVSGQFQAPVALPLERGPQYPLYEGWVGPRAGIYAVEKRKKSFDPIGNRTQDLGSAARSSRYTDWAILGLMNYAGPPQDIKNPFITLMLKKMFIIVIIIIIKKYS
jgi:hypothetical protein